MKENDTMTTDTAAVAAALRRRELAPTDYAAKKMAEAITAVLRSYGYIVVPAAEHERLVRFAKALTEYGVHHGNCPLDSWSKNLTRCKCGLFALIKDARAVLEGSDR